MRSFAVAGVVALLPWMVGCVEEQTNVHASTKTVVEKPSRSKDYKIKITIHDENSKVVFEKTVCILNYSYMPEFEQQKDVTNLLQWYEGFHYGGACVLKQGWIADWSKVEEEEKVIVPLPKQSQPSSRLKASGTEPNGVK